MVEGTVKDRTVCCPFQSWTKQHCVLLLHVENTANTIDLQRQIIKNLSAVLEASGSSLADVAKVNVFLADMKDFQDMNDVYMEGFPEPRPVCFVPWTP
jgi:GTP1/Obg family GTP-binding protein